MQTATTNASCLKFAKIILSYNGGVIPTKEQNELLKEFFPLTASPNWKIYSRKFFAWYERFVASEMTKQDNSKIFAKSGNRKLPFLSFSTMPDVTCPGAGECLSFCYSFKGWRNVHPFFRQLRNTLLMKYSFSTIKGEMKKVLNERKFKNMESVDFRLYVDGDFSSLFDVAYWMDLLAETPRVNAYGYSKSWKELLAYNEGNEFPSNYVLNISSGSKFTMKGKLFDKVSGLSCTRNAFMAIRIANGLKIDTPAYRKALKVAANEQGISKMFICGGSCGDCTKIGHACGLASLNAPVVIGIH